MKDRLTSKQIAELFGVSHNTVLNWRQRESAGVKFPKPCGSVPTGHKPALVWRPETVIAWAIKTGRWDVETNQPIKLEFFGNKSFY